MHTADSLSETGSRNRQVRRRPGGMIGLLGITLPEVSGHTAWNYLCLSGLSSYTLTGVTVVTTKPFPLVG